MAHELEHSVLHMDRGILYSLKELMLRPGRLMRDYIEGRRARQAKPLLLLMVMAAAVVFLSKYILGAGVIDGSLPQVDFQAAGAGGKNSLDPAAMQAAFATVGDLMDRNFAAFTLLLLPFEAAAFRLAFGRVGKLNYPEWLAITAFLTVQAFVFWIIALPLQRWFPYVQNLVMWVAMGYGVFSLVQFFSGYPRWKSALRAMAGFGAFLLVGGLVTVVLVVALLVKSMAG
ncbi:DUF3667 domain-containing protein [Pseudoxanthomonas daejeonensis]|nr:DUF3667 domain-containing protein [Pseudoxanthomonas daejeonensis]